MGFRKTIWEAKRTFARVCNFFDSRAIARLQGDITLARDFNVRPACSYAAILDGGVNASVIIGEKEKADFINSAEISISEYEARIAGRDKKYKLQ